MSRQIVLDTETTGLVPEEGHRIIEVGCLELVNRRITGSTFHRYINPQRSIERGAEEVHGITTDFLKDKPLFTDIVDELIDYIKGAELIIHNAPFDIGFLNHEFKLANRHLKPVTDYCTVTDSLTVARHKHPGQRNSLDALCRRYTVDNSNRDLHGALLDAELLAQVYLLMTGGQTQLFAEATNNESTQTTSTQIKRLADTRTPLPIIEPNPEELAAHNDFLAMLNAKGQCLWTDSDH